MPKKPVTNKLNTGNTSTNADRPAAKGFTHKRSRATINRLKMYNTRPIRNKGGKILGGSFMSSELPSNTRIAPSSSYFGPTRFIGQEQLAAFREAINKTKQDPFKVLLRPGKIPMGLITESKAEPKVKILDTESYESVFGPKKQRKRPRITQFEYSDLVTTASEKAGEYDDTKDKNIRVELDMWDERRHDVFEKGHSKRIYAELYKVLDASDVVIQVLDARDPMGTRSPHLEKHIKENARYKHLVLILNKCDLIPAWATARWVSVLSKEYPTLAFHSSLTHPFGKGALITLLRQFSKLHSDKKQIGVGFVGYPNVGKSSIINTLKASKVCKAAPIPGQTKIWQYVRLTRKINLIDCPGVVPPQEKNDTEVVLRGVIRVENLPDATEFVPAVLERVKKEYVARHYNLPATWTDAEDFLIKLAEKSGKLLKKGEPDVVTVSKLVLYDWQKGRLPFFSLPPLPTALEEAKAKALKEEQERLEKEAEEKTKERQERIDRGEIDEDDHEEAPKVEAADLNVAQNFGRINVKHAYDEDDTNPEGKGVSFSDAPDWDDLFKSVEADMGSDDEIDSEDDHGDNNDVISDGEDNDEEDGEDGDDVIEVKDDDDEVIEIKDDEEEEDVDLAPKKSKKARIEKSEAKSAKSEAKPVKSEKVAKSDKIAKSKQTSTPPAKPTKTTKTAKATTPTPAAKPTKATPNKTPTTTTKTTPAAQTSTTKTTPTTKTTKKPTPVKKELLIPYEQQSKSRARNVSDDDEIIDDETERKPKKIITSLKTKKVKLIDGGGKRVISFDEQAADNKRKRRGGASGKEKRMTTNKKKAGVHFYATANVKNRRNRSNKDAQNDD